MKKAVIVFALALIGVMAAAQTPPPRNIFVQDQITFYWGETKADFIEQNGQPAGDLDTALVYLVDYQGKPRTTMFMFKDDILFGRAFMISPTEYQDELDKVKVMYPHIVMSNGQFCAGGVDNQKISFALDESGGIRMCQFFLQ